MKVLVVREPPLPPEKEPNLAAQITVTLFVTFLFMLAVCGIVDLIQSGFRN